MIDNIKFFATNKEEFEQNVCKISNIEFKAPYSILTGEMMDYPKRGKLLNLDVNFTPESGYINGSLHKFHNCLLTESDHNYNDFDYNELMTCLNELESQTGLCLDKTKITNLEFGVNILISKNPQEIIDNNLMMFNHKSASKDSKFRGKGDYKEFQKTDYSIKIYNKSKQYNQSGFILRVELKITMKRVLERIGIFNLNDLKDKEILKTLFDFFMEKINKVHIIDDFEDRQNIPQKAKDKLIKYTSSFHWGILLKKPQNIRRYHLMEFEKLIIQYSLDKLKTEILDKINKKFKLLLNPQSIRLVA